MFALRSANILSSQRQEIREKTQRIQYLLKNQQKQQEQISKQNIIYTHLKKKERKFVINNQFILP